MAVTTDGNQAKSTFDPDAPCAARDGLSYKCFADRIRGRPDPNDPTNSQIERLVEAGHSEAFCREYRIGYARHARIIDAAADSVRANRESRRHWFIALGHDIAHRAGLVNAEGTCPEETAAITYTRNRSSPFHPAAAIFGLRFAT